MVAAGHFAGVITRRLADAPPANFACLSRSTTPAVIWRSGDGREVASDDPSFDPRTPIDADWRRVR